MIRKRGTFQVRTLMQGSPDDWKTLFVNSVYTPFLVFCELRLASNWFLGITILIRYQYAPCLAIICTTLELVLPFFLCKTIIGGMWRFPYNVCITVCSSSFFLHFHLWWTRTITSSMSTRCEAIYGQTGWRWYINKGRNTVQFESSVSLRAYYVSCAAGDVRQ